MDPGGKQPNPDAHWPCPKHLLCPRQHAQHERGAHKLGAHSHGIRESSEASNQVSPRLSGNCGLEMGQECRYAVPLCVGGELGDLWERHVSQQARTVQSDGA